MNCKLALAVGVATGPTLRCAAASQLAKNSLQSVPFVTVFRKRKWEQEKDVLN